MNKSLRIIILVPSFPINVNDIKGGVHSAIINLLHGFLSQDIDVRVISFTKETKKKIFVKFSDRIEIVHEPEGPFPIHSLNYLFVGPFILKRNINEFNPDLIHFQTGNTLKFTKLFGTLGIKTILTIHAFAFEEMKTKTSIKDKLTYWFNGTINELFPIANIIYISESSKNSHLNKKIKNSVVIPNALRPAYFELLPKEKTDNRILYIGVINNRKNLLFLLKVLNQLFKENVIYTLDVLGGFKDEEYKNVINDYLNNSDIKHNVFLHGWIDQSESLRFIAENDIFAITSFQETLPMVIAETMAAGKVVVSTAVGGIPEMIINEQNGFMFNIKDENAFYNILKLLYNNDGLLSDVGKKAKDFATTRYYCNKVAEKTIKFYYQVINS